LDSFLRLTLSLSLLCTLLFILSHNITFPLEEKPLLEKVKKLEKKEEERNGSLISAFTHLPKPSNSKSARTSVYTGEKKLSLSYEKPLFHIEH